MTDKELLYIRTIADEHNITHAAEKLHVAQPSLSQCVQRLESELGCLLFIRRKYGLDLTEAGRLYYQMACDIMERQTRFLEDLTRLKAADVGMLTIGASWYNTLLFLSELISDFNAKYPHVELNLVEKRTAELLRIFSEGKADVILIHEYPREYAHARKDIPKNMQRDLLLDEPFVIVTSERYDLSPLLGENGVDLAGLASYPFISFNDNQRLRHITDFAFENAGVVTQKVVKTQSFPGTIELVNRGVGLAVLPAYYVKRNIGSYQNLKSYRILPKYYAYWSTYVCYKRPEHLSVAIRNLTAILTNIADRIAETE